MRLDSLAQGYTVEIASGSVVLIDRETDEMKEFPSIEKAKEWVLALLEAAEAAGEGK